MNTIHGTGSARVIVVASTKGGVGKSTTTHNMACFYSSLGFRVAIVDCDPQSTTFYLAQARREAGLPISHTAFQFTQGRVHENLGHLSSQIDIILIDVGGTDNDLLRSSLFAAAQAGNNGLILIPMLPGQIDTWGAIKIVGILKEIEVVSPVVARIFMNKVHPNPMNALSHDTSESIESDHSIPYPMLVSRLVTRAPYSNTAQGRTIFDSPRMTRAIEEFTDLAIEVATILKLDTPEMRGIRNAQ